MGDGVPEDYVVRRNAMSSKSARFVPSIRLAQYDVTKGSYRVMQINLQSEQYHSNYSLRNKHLFGSSGVRGVVDKDISAWPSQVTV